MALRVSQQILQQDVCLMELYGAERKDALATESLLKDLAVLDIFFAVRLEGHEVAPAYPNENTIRFKVIRRIRSEVCTYSLCMVKYGRLL